MSTLPARLKEVLVRLTPDRPDALDDLRGLYADNLVFRDPIQVVRGIDDFLAMNRRLLGKMRSLEWNVLAAVGDDNEAYLEWIVSGATKFGPKVKLEGMTRVHARDGKIYDHRDYWDLGELMTSSIPGGQRILHTLLSPFA